MAQLLAVIGPQLGLGAKALTTIGKIVTIAQPIAGIATAVAGAAQARQQANEYKRQGREERVAANLKAERMRRQARLRESRDRVAMLEGGALSGTAPGVLNQNAVAYELDALTVEYQGEQAGRSADFNAKQAKRRAGPLPIFSAAIRGFSQIDPMNLAYNGGAGAL